MEAISLRLLSKSFPRLFTGFLEIVGIGVFLELELIDHSALLQAKDLDLNVILAHPISLSSLLKIHLPPGTDSVDIVRSSMKVRLGGCQSPDLDLGPLHQSVEASLAFSRFLVLQVINF